MCLILMNRKFFKAEIFKIFQRTRAFRLKLDSSSKLESQTRHERTRDCEFLKVKMRSIRKLHIDTH